MGTAERILSEAELNRALLARQLLLANGRGSIANTLERIAGIQAQYAPAMYIGLWSRIEDFERESLTRALERRTVVQGTLLRITIHLVSPAQWWTWSEAVREARRELWLRAHKGTPGARALAGAARRLGPVLERGPISRKELAAVVGLGSSGVNGVGLWRDLVRAPPSGTWARRRADLYADARLWLGDPPVIDPGEATAELVKAYLRGFGPATPKQVANWAGLAAKPVAATLERLELRRFVSADGETLFDLPRAPLPAGDTPAPARFLPAWDATLLVHARRTQILREGDRQRVFSTKTPQSVNTFLVDGQVAGTWKYGGGRIAIAPFRKLDPAKRRELDREAERLAAFHAD